MPDFPIVDTHLHLWDLQNLRYPWLDEEPPLNRNFLLEDYYQATQNLHVSKMVFMQCDCLPEQAIEEARWVAGLMQQEPRLVGMVARARLELGEKARPEIEALLKVNPGIKGIRRLFQGEPELDFCLQEDVIKGVGLLAEYDLPFDLCLNYRHLPNALKFAEQLPNVRMVIDHIAKPDIKGKQFEVWADGITQIAQLEHVHCKLSSLATEADQQNWEIEDLRPYVSHVIEQFGIDRCFFASDWPVCTLAADLETCVNTLDTLLEGYSAEDKYKIFAQNGEAFYRV